MLEQAEVSGAIAAIRCSRSASAVDIDSTENTQAGEAAVGNNASDFWEAWQWEHLSEVSIDTLISVPNSFANAYAERKGDLVKNFWQLLQALLVNSPPGSA